MDSSGENPILDPNKPIDKTSFSNPQLPIEHAPEDALVPDASQQAEVTSGEPSEPLPQEQPPVVERELSPEQLQQIRQSEAQRVVHVHIARAGHEVRKGGTDLNESQEAAYGYYVITQDLMKRPNGRFAEAFSLEGGNELFVSFKNNSYLAAGPEGQAITAITEKVDKDGGMYFRCMINNQEVEVSAAELLNSQVLAEQEALQKLFAENTDERKVMDSYLSFLKNRDKGIQIDEMTMREAGIRTGLIDAEGIRSLITQAVKEGPSRDRLLQDFQGQVILNPETAGDFIAGMNTTEPRIKQLDSTISQQEQEIAKLRNKLQGITDDTEGAKRIRHELEGQIAAIQAEVGVFKTERDQLQKLKEALPVGDQGIIQLVTQLYEGTMSASQAQRINQALHEGKMDKLLEELVGGLPEDSEERNKYTELIKNAAKYGGLGAMALLAILIMKAMGEQR